MPWYVRKYVRAGPVRFNLSKSGIGTSVGVTGFRVGVRPSGSSYLHAGRHGLYYRHELGRPTSDNETRPSDIEDVHNPNPDTIRYDSATSHELTSQPKKDLLAKLNHSYKAFRLDYLCGAMFLVLSLILLSQNAVLGALCIVSGMVITVAVALWESKRRTITITYDFHDQGASAFKQLISSFNGLASNEQVWVLAYSRNVHNDHESKLNAGAANLVGRENVQLGEGKPPWVNTNIDVPALKARKQTLYMMPDGILIYDSTGVGFVCYEDVSLSNSTTRFIEEHPPSDAEVVGRTWKYPNKKGGPDRRFNNNYEIPLCRYGQLEIKSKSGMFLYLMTSKHDSASTFSDEFAKALSAAATRTGPEGKD
jgi:hypothetical protein